MLSYSTCSTYSILVLLIPVAGLGSWVVVSPSRPPRLPDFDLSPGLFLGSALQTCFQAGVEVMEGLEVHASQWPLSKQSFADFWDVSCRYYYPWSYCTYAVHTSVVTRWCQLLQSLLIPTARLVSCLVDSAIPCVADDSTVYHGDETCFYVFLVELGDLLS